MTDFFDIALWAGGAVLVALFVALVVWAVQQPSCEDKGGKQYVAGYTTVMSGKVPITTPFYSCDMPS